MIPWRVLGTIIFLTLFVLFASFNLENSCDINLIIFKMKNVPVFLSMPAAFLTGSLFMFPFIIGGIFKRRKKDGNKSKKKSETSDKKESGLQIETKKY